MPKSSARASGPVATFVALDGADKQRVKLRGGAGIDIVAGPLRAVIHPFALGNSDTDLTSVAAGHDPMEIRLFAKRRHRIRTQAGVVRSLGPALGTKVRVDGTKAPLVLAGTTTQGWSLKPGQRLVTIAKFTKSGRGNANAVAPSVGVFPSIVGFDAPTLGSHKPAAEFGTRSAGFQEPLVGWGNPLVLVHSKLFDFEIPIGAFEGPLLRVNRTAPAAGAPTASISDDLDPMTLGFFATPTVYVGPASLTDEGMLGVIAAKGTLRELGFGVLTTKGK